MPRNVPSLKAIINVQPCNNFNSGYETEFSQVVPRNKQMWKIKAAVHEVSSFRNIFLDHDIQWTVCSNELPHKVTFHTTTP